MNRRPPPYQGGALPTELYQHKKLRGQDLNLRPSGYEPDELPTAPPRGNMMEGEGFEPSKAELTDLQSVPFGHSGTPPYTGYLPANYIIQAQRGFVKDKFNYLVKTHQEFYFNIEPLACQKMTVPAHKKMELRLILRRSPI